MNQITAAMSWMYRGMLRLYPPSFRAKFTCEMEAVFAQVLDEASKQGTVPVLVNGLRELGDLPVNLLLEHVRERRNKPMKLFSYDETQGIRITRRIARLGGLMLNGFYCAIVLTTRQPILLTLTIAVMVIAWVVAWHWEKAGGLLMISTAFICAALVGIHGMLTVDHLSFFMAVLWGLGCMLVVLTCWVPVYLIWGWLFVSLARRDHLTRQTHSIPHMS
ncbi:MAG: hypothetical protein JXN59_18800 [Anaerolineae bacterium]|nr:hypothetical protein [Anaerolineae bacterium]